jgi:hypothetical protein
MSWHHQDW